MKTLRLALPLIMLMGWSVGAGCDDDRGVVDLGAGDAPGLGGAAGEATRPGSGGGDAGVSAGGAAVVVGAGGASGAGEGVAEGGATAGGTAAVGGGVAEGGAAGAAP